MSYGLGLLAAITDPESMARFNQRQRLAERVVQQTGCTLEMARNLLDTFEEDAGGVPAHLRH
jgi:hypothetical protein